MSEDQYLKLFTYMTDRFDRLERELATKADANEMLTRLDGIIARLDKDDTERASLEHKVDRHEGWINQLADTSGTKPSYR